MELRGEERSQWASKTSCSLGRPEKMFPGRTPWSAWLRPAAEEGICPRGKTKFLPTYTELLRDSDLPASVHCKSLRSALLVIVLPRIKTRVLGLLCTRFRWPISQPISPVLTWVSWCTNAEMLSTFFRSVGPGNQTQFIQHGGKNLYLLSQLTILYLDV